MKFATTSVAALRPSSALVYSNSTTLRAALTASSSRTYATQTSLGKSPSAPKTRRRSVTPFNDDGQIPWSELSGGEKAARATQQTVNFGLVLAGIGLTGGVAYLFYTEVFSPDSKVANFGRAVDLIKKDPTCQSVLGDPKKILAHGEETSNKWRRARPIASTITTDRTGVEHLQMRFYVEGPLNRGTAHLHMTRNPRQGEGDFEYRYLYVDVRGHQRIYLKNADEDTAAKGSAKSKTKWFGINFGS